MTLILFCELVGPAAVVVVIVLHQDFPRSGVVLGVLLSRDLEGELGNLFSEEALLELQQPQVRSRQRTHSRAV